MEKERAGKMVKEKGEEMARTADSEIFSVAKEKFNLNMMVQ